MTKKINWPFVTRYIFKQRQIMSNITAMRAFWRRMNYYLNTPVFTKYGRSVRISLLSLLNFLH